MNNLDRLIAENEKLIKELENEKIIKELEEEVRRLNKKILNAQFLLLLYGEENAGVVFKFLSNSNCTVEDIMREINDKGRNYE